VIGLGASKKIMGFGANEIRWVGWSNRFAKLDGKSTWDLQNLIALQNLLTQAIAEINVLVPMTSSMVPPTLEDEEEHLG
jgi:hypothetical protein